MVEILYLCDVLFQSHVGKFFSDSSELNDLLTELCTVSCKVSLNKGIKIECFISTFRLQELAEKGSLFV